MKKFACLLLALLLILTACAPGGGDTTPDETTLPQGVTQPQEPTEAPRVEHTPEESKSPLKPLPGEEDGLVLDYENPGKVRINYQGDRGYVRYVTSPEELPREDALAGYDAAFFEKHALVLVVETVSSGSVRVDFGTIFLIGDTARVRLNREMDGEVGTADMATWLLWAEVEKDLDYNWELEGAEDRFNGSSKY